MSRAAPHPHLPAHPCTRTAKHPARRVLQHSRLDCSTSPKATKPPPQYRTQPSTFPKPPQSTPIHNQNTPVTQSATEVPHARLTTSAAALPNAAWCCCCSRAMWRKLNPGDKASPPHVGMQVRQRGARASCGRQAGGRGRGRGRTRRGNWCRRGRRPSRCFQASRLLSLLLLVGQVRCFQQGAAAAALAHSSKK